MRRLVLLMLAVACGASPAFAARELEPPDLSRYLRWGPLRVRPGVELSNLGYDDNIFLDSVQAKVGDYTATLAPKADGLILLGHRAFITFDERLEYTLYLDNNDQNFLNHRGKARLTVPLKRFGVFTDLVMNRVRERPADREDIRARRREDGLGVGLIFEPGWRTTIEAGVTTTDWRYSDPDSPGGAAITIGDRLDRRETGTRVRVGYRLVGRTDLTLEARQRDIEFDNPTLRRDAQETSLLPGVRFQPGGTLTGTVRAGVTRIDVTDTDQPDLREFVADAQLAFRPSPDTQLTVDGRRQAGFALFEGDLFYVEQVLGLRAVRYLQRAIGIESGFSVGRLSFPDTLSAIERRDQTLRYDVGVRLRLAETTLGRRVEYSLRLGRYRRDSNLEFLDQTQTTFGLNAIVGY